MVEVFRTGESSSRILLGDDSRAVSAFSASLVRQRIHVHVSLCPFVLGSLLFDVLPEVFVFSVFWSDSGYRLTSVYRGFLGDFTQVVCEGGLGPCGPPGLLCLSLCNDRCPRTLSVRSCRARRRQQWYGWFCWLRCTSHCVLRCNARCSLCLQRQVRKVQTVQLPAWTRVLTCPLLCSTDARFRRAENAGAPQLQFVDQVESSLFGNRDRYAQCNCAVVSCHGWCFLDS